MRALGEGDTALDAEAKQIVVALERALIDPDDRTPALVTVRAAAGGLDAEDWARMLLRAYMRWAQRRGMPVQLFDCVDGRADGLRQATIRIDHPHAYGLLRHETGGHRIAHHSRFGSSGKRQTSFAAVEVLPDRPSAVQGLLMNDVTIATYGGSSKGGQHANKSSTNVRATHVPTGISAQSVGRSLHSNRNRALAVLAARVEQAETRERDGVFIDASFGHRVRSYTFTPYQMVCDDRAGVKTRRLQAILDGELEGLLWPLAMQG